MIKSHWSSPDQIDDDSLGVGIEKDSQNRNHLIWLFYWTIGYFEPASVFIMIFKWKSQEVL